MTDKDREYEARREAERTEELEKLRAERVSLLAELRQAGVREVIAEFDGEGGDSSVDLLECLPSPQDKSLVLRVDEFIENLLVVFYPGYDEEHGAFGDLCWKLDDDQLIVNFCERVRAYKRKKIQHNLDGWIVLEKSEEIMIEED